jgi:Spy/CpxP family protein refolding chaperone
MKKLNLVFTLLLLLSAGSFSLQAQNRHHELSKERLQNIQNAKIAFLTEKLSLTPEQSQKFWPIYNQLENERENLREKSRALRSENLEAMSDTEIRTALNNRLNWRQEEIDLDKRYMERFTRVISVRQLASLYRNEREFTKVLLRKLDSGHNSARSGNK